MALAGVGIDMLEIRRMEKTLERRPSFAGRVFTEEERAYCESHAMPARHFAARFAARGAVLKALGSSFAEGVGLGDVSVGTDAKGRPAVILSGEARRLAESKGVLEVALSISYTHEVATATAVAQTELVRPVREDKVDPKEELRASFRAARTVLDELEGLERAGQSQDEKEQTI